MITHGENGPRLQANVDLVEASNQSPIVMSMLRARAPKSKIILALVEHIETLTTRILRLDGKGKDVDD